jgi:hypothetical protein
MMMPEKDPDPVMEANIEKLVHGTRMIKHGRKGFPHERGVRLTLTRDAIITKYTTKGGQFSSFSFLSFFSVSFCSSVFEECE